MNNLGKTLAVAAAVTLSSSVYAQDAATPEKVDDLQETATQEITETAPTTVDDLEKK